MVGWNL